MSPLQQMLWIAWVQRSSAWAQIKLKEDGLRCEAQRLLRKAIATQAPASFGQTMCAATVPLRVENQQVPSRAQLAAALRSSGFRQAAPLARARSNSGASPQSERGQPVRASWDAKAADNTDVPSPFQSHALRVLHAKHARRVPLAKPATQPNSAWQTGGTPQSTGSASPLSSYSALQFPGTRSVTSVTRFLSGVASKIGPARLNLYAARPSGPCAGRNIGRDIRL